MRISDWSSDVCSSDLSAHSDEQFAVGSIVKLYILDELAAQVAAGKRRWSDVVPLSHQSFSSAGTANWPKDTPVTVQSLANWMIRTEEHTTEIQSLMRTSYAVFCLKKKKQQTIIPNKNT